MKSTCLATKCQCKIERSTARLLTEQRQRPRRLPLRRSLRLSSESEDETEKAKRESPVAARQTFAELPELFRKQLRDSWRRSHPAVTPEVAREVCRDRQPPDCCQRAKYR